MDQPLSKEETAAKVRQYEEFIDNRLKVQLVRVLDERDQLFTKISQFLEVKKTIHLIQEQNLRSMETLVNLGSDHFVQARIPDTSFIHIDIGLGFHAQFTLEEGSLFIDEKTKILEEQAKQLTEKGTQIKAHIKLIYEGISELLDF